MSQPKQPLAWNDPIIMLEGDASVAKIPESDTGVAESELMLRTVLSIAVSLRRLADQHAPEPAQPEEFPESQPTASPVEPGNSYPESYWAKDVGATLSHMASSSLVPVPEGAVERVLAALHAALEREAYKFGHLGPSKPTRGGTVTSPPPMPDHALRAMLMLSADAVRATTAQHAPPVPDLTNLVHTLALAVRGLRSVVTDGGKGYLDGVHRAQADYALGLYRDTYPDLAEVTLDEPHGRLIP